MNSSKLISALVVLALMAHNAATQAAPVGLRDGREIQIDYTDARGIRLFEGDTYLLDFLKVHDGFTIEDRTVIEFDVSRLSGVILQATLLLGIDNFDPGGSIGIIDVFTYVGDGVVTADEFYAGAWYASISFNGDREIVPVDVASFVQCIIDTGEQFAGFRLSTETSDRYLLGEIVAMPEPVLTVIPEPGVLALLTFGGTCLVLCRRGSPMRMG